MLLYAELSKISYLKLYTHYSPSSHRPWSAVIVLESFFLTMVHWITSIAAIAALSQHAFAQNMLRFACSQLVVERTDPLVNPGMIYTPHLHQIVGGDAFNVTMDPTIDIAQTSKCTSCSFVQDKSNYWTAVMFFKAANGSYIRVPQVRSPSFSYGVYQPLIAESRLEMADLKES